jgi:hypothetical protein
MTNKMEIKLVMQSSREYTDSKFKHMARNNIQSMISNRRSKMTNNTKEKSFPLSLFSPMLPKRLSCRESSYRCSVREEPIVERKSFPKKHILDTYFYNLRIRCKAAQCYGTNPGFGRCHPFQRVGRGVVSSNRSIHGLTVAKLGWDLTTHDFGKSYV